MSLYYQLKSNLTLRCVTERYGPPIHCGNMICCLRAPKSSEYSYGQQRVCTG